MSLEEFLSYRPLSYKKILHPPSVDIEWNIVDAYHLIDYVCFIISLIEKDEKDEYIDLYGYLDKKEIYYELHKELSELMNKHNFPKHNRHYVEYEEKFDQYISHYWDNLEHADMLVARDNAWRNIFNHEDF